MPRVARIVVTDTPHHITQRGNNRQDVFFTSDDRRVYLKFLAAQAQKSGLVVIAYCLMTNHVHLIALPRRADSLAKALGRTHWLYSQYVNRLHRRSFVGRVYSPATWSNPLSADLPRRRRLHYPLCMPDYRRRYVHGGTFRVCVTFSILRQPNSI